MFKTIPIDEVRISKYHRESLPWTVDQIVASIKDHGFNTAYPIVLDSDNTLVDGGHRIEAARMCNLVEVPYITKPDGISNIRFRLQCNADRTKGREDDVFDLATLCWGLSRDGWERERIAQELEWSPTVVTQYRQIKELLHPSTWALARTSVAKTPRLATADDDSLATPGVAIAMWRESHFRALLKHLPCTGSDRAAMRAQMLAIREALNRWEGDRKVTAQWIEGVAARHAWHLHLKRYATEHLVKEVGIDDRKVLFKHINNDVFGREESDRNKQKLEQAVYLLNEKTLGIRLYHEDALERIPLLKDGSVALVIADPPYNVTDATWDRFASPEEYLEWMGAWLKALRPKLAADYHLFLFCSPSYMARIEQLLIDQGWPLKSRVIWAYRNLSMGRDVADKFISSWQPVFHCGTHSLNWGPGWSDERLDVQIHASPQSNFRDRKQHPVAKPLKLIELFVRAGSKPGDIVLDPFAGGGVTGEACSAVKQRRCVLIEKEEEFVSAIERRLNLQRVKDESV